MKVGLINSNGAIGQRLALLYAKSSKISALNLFDIVDQKGVAMDVSDIDSNCRINYHKDLKDSVTGNDIIVVTAGLPRKPGMTNDDLFNINAKIIADIAKEVALNAPKSFLAIFTNPVSATVPIACEVFKKYGISDTKRIFGVTILDTMKGHRFIDYSFYPFYENILCPVVGGHSGKTKVPHFIKESCLEGNDSIKEYLAEREEIYEMIQRIRNAGSEVVEVKKTERGSYSLSYAVYKFTLSLIKAITSKDNVKEYSFINLEKFDSQYSKYFSVPILINKDGVHQTLKIENITPEESKKLLDASQDVDESIKKAEEFIKNFEK